MFAWTNSTSASEIYYQSSATTIYQRWITTQATTTTAGIWSSWQEDPFTWTPQRAQRMASYGELARDVTPPIDPAYVARVKEEKRLAALAEERADTLLMSLLTPDQLLQYRAARCFEVCTKAGRRYRLERKISGGVTLVGPDGRASARYCAHLSGSLPIPDHLIAQKFMLEHHEEEFLRVANRS